MSQKIDLKVEYTNRLAQENEALKAQVEALLEPAKEAAEALGFASHHLRGRASENMLMDMAEKADELISAIGSTPAQCLAARDAEVKVLAFEQAGIPKGAKAGCIGEFKFTIEGARCCPECYNNDPSNDCEMCGGESGENGVSDLTVSVPWDLCKEIWLKMNQFAADELRQQGEQK